MDINKNNSIETNIVDMIEGDKKIPVYIYFHICVMSNWVEIVQNSIKFIKKSKLYDRCDEIRCCILGKYNILPSCLNDTKIKIIAQNTNRQIYERFTLRILHEHSLKEKFYGFYIHSKGVLKNKVNWNWINEMLRSNCNHHIKIIELLDDYHTVGTRFTTKKIGPHYSGNFWWFNSEYIAGKSNHIDKNIRILNLGY